MTDDRLLWWAARVYDAVEYGRYTVDESGDDDVEYLHADPVLDTMIELVVELDSER